MARETCHRQLGVAARALLQPRGQPGTRAGTGLPLGLQPLAPGMLAYKNAERLHHMTGPRQDMALPGPCPLSCPGARPGMALKQGTGLNESLLQALIGQGLPGSGSLPL